MKFAITVEGEQWILSRPHFAAWALFADRYELSRNAIQRGERNQSAVERPCGETKVLAFGKYEAMLLGAVGGHQEYCRMLAFAIEKQRGWMRRREPKRARNIRLYRR